MNAPFFGAGPLAAPRAVTPRTFAAQIDDQSFAVVGHGFGVPLRINYRAPGLVRAFRPGVRGAEQTWVSVAGLLPDPIKLGSAPSGTVLDAEFVHEREGYVLRPLDCVAYAGRLIIGLPYGERVAIMRQALDEALGVADSGLLPIAGWTPARIQVENKAALAWVFEGEPLVATLRDLRAPYRGRGAWIVRASDVPATNPREPLR